MQTGDVVQLGQHRLMCGDAGNPEHVAKLFGDTKPDLVFTSPPYLQQRQYGQAIKCWDTLMQRVFGAMPWHEKTQVLVNLGMVHRKGEWLPYWDNWIEWMRTQGWRRFACYVWFKQSSLPGQRHGRLAPEHENIFHFNKQSKEARKTVPCVYPNHPNRCVGRSSVKGGYGGYTKRKSGTHKIMGSVVHCKPASRWESDGSHPAVFPIALPVQFINAYTDLCQTIFDPFCGSGTSILAAEQTGRICYGMEISPEYCAIAVERWHKRKPVQSTHDRPSQKSASSRLC